MTLGVAILLLVSAVTHAGWNLLGKREQPSTAFFLVANTCGCLCLLPVLAPYGQALATFPSRVWGLICLTGLCEAVYYAALAGAYRAGELSVAYPLARSAPVIMVALATRLLGQGAPLSSRAMLGIALVLAGSLLLPLRRFSDLNLRAYWHIPTLLALVAALGTSGYSMIDDAALRLLRQTARPPMGRVEVTLLYALLQGLSASAWLIPFAVSTRRERTALLGICRHGMAPAALTGVGIHLTYSLVLIAMGWVTNVSYVVAFRQLSIPLGAILGVAWLKEPRYPLKFVGVATMFLGLVVTGSS